MPINVAALAVEIKRAGQPDRVKKDLTDIDKKGKKAGTSIQGLKTALMGLGAGLSLVAVGRFLKGAVADAMEAERALNALAISVENTGQAFQEVRAETDAAANQLQELTRFSDEDARLAMAELTRITGDASSAMDILGVTSDVAAATGLDLVKASQYVGRVLNGETAVLKRYGIVIGENEDALEGMRRVVGGFAENEAQTLGGSLVQVKNEFADVTQAIGEAIIEGLEFGDAADTMKDALQKVEDWLYANQTAIAAGINILAKAFQLGLRLVDLFGTTITQTFKLVGNILGNVGALIVGIFTFDITLIKTSLSELKNSVVADTQVIRDELVKTGEAFVALAESIGVAAAGGGAPGPVAGRAPGRGKPVVQPGAAAPVGGRPQFGWGLGGLGLMLEEAQRVYRLLGKQVMEEVTDDTLDAAGEAATMIEQGIGQTLGDAISEGLNAAFDAGSVGDFMKGFGQALLGGFGEILVQLGQTLIAYGTSLTALQPLLTNIFTAGPAAIAAGALILGLGKAFTNVTSGRGAGPAGAPTGGGFSPPPFTGFPGITAREIITFGAAPAPITPLTPVNFTVIGSNDPRAQRDIVELIHKAERRGLS